MIYDFVFRAPCVYALATRGIEQKGRGSGDENWCGFSLGWLSKLITSKKQTKFLFPCHVIDVMLNKLKHEV